MSVTYGLLGTSMSSSSKPISSTSKKHYCQDWKGLWVIDLHIFIYRATWSPSWFWSDPDLTSKSYIQIPTPPYLNQPAHGQPRQLQTKKSENLSSFCQCLIYCKKSGTYCVKVTDFLFINMHDIVSCYIKDVHAYIFWVILCVLIDDKFGLGKNKCCRFTPLK